MKRVLTQAELKAELKRQTETAQAAQEAMGELMRQFNVEDFHVTTSPLGPTGGMDILADEAIALTDRIHEALSG